MTALTKELFMAYYHAPADIVELENPIKVHMVTAKGNNFDFSIKFLWFGMVGFDVWYMNCCCCTAERGCKITMPDDTVIENDNSYVFIDQVVNWSKRHNLKLVTADEVEFMDI